MRHLKIVLFSLTWLFVYVEMASAESSPYLPVFTAPPISNTNPLSKKQMYAKLWNDVDIYAEPSYSSAVIRNSGYGYFYVSIYGSKEVEGSWWYMINYKGEWVPETALEFVKPSQFHGVQITEQPQRPFGWAYSAIRPSPYPGGTPSSRFPLLTRYSFFQIYDSVRTADNSLWYNIGTGGWIPSYGTGIVDLSPRPEGVGKNSFWTEVNIDQQTMAAYEGDTMVFATAISSGLNKWATRLGLFQVWDRWESIKMSGAEGKYDYYYIEDVPFVMYFNYEIGFHAAYWHDAFGSKQSHGCVNMSLADSGWLFNWSEESKEALWVHVHSTRPEPISKIADSAESNLQPTRWALTTPLRHLVGKGVSLYH